MIYIVTGTPRSGTSMIMDAIQAGGIPVVRSDERDKFAESLSDENYNVNEWGLFEASDEQLHDPDFPMKYGGQAVKLVFGVLQFMRPHWLRVPSISGPGYQMFRPGNRVLCMVRHPEEVRQSFYAAMKVSRPQMNSKDNRKEWVKYGKQVKLALAFMKRRRDVLTLSVLNYGRVLRDPVKAFQRLAWPIDIERAASTVRPAMQRFDSAEIRPGL